MIFRPDAGGLLNIKRTRTLENFRVVFRTKFCFSPIWFLAVISVLMCGYWLFRCSAKTAQRSYWWGQWWQQSINGSWWSARFWRPRSSRSTKFNCQCRTIRTISRKHARLDWYTSRRFQQGIFSTSTSIGRTSTFRPINLWGHTGKQVNIPIQCYTPYVHIVCDSIPDITPDICHSDIIVIIPDIWPDITPDI